MLFISFYSLAQNYEVSKTTDQNQSFMIFHLRDAEQDVAKLCLFDPKKTFDFFSKESDPEFFVNNIEGQLDKFAKAKKNSQPMSVVLGSFEKSKNAKKFYPGYFWESLALLIIMPSYFDEINIINTSPKAKRFYLKVWIDNKYYYSLLVSNNPITITEAKNLFRAVKPLNLDHKIKPIPINDFPVKLISFDNDKIKTIYASDSLKRNYTCMFMSVK